MKKFLFLLLIVASVVFSSCHQELKNYEYITCGHAIQYNIPVACTWENDESLNLEAIGINSHAYDAGLFDKDLVIVGDVFLNGFTKACYWKNRQRINLGSSGQNSTAKGVFVSAYDLCISGQQANVASLWRNGIRTILMGRPNFSSIANGVTVLGIDAFSAGSEYDATSEFACVWINNVRYPLSTVLSRANAIDCTSTKAVAVGFEYDGATSHRRACYWEITPSGSFTRTFIGASDAESEATSITIVNNTVYIGGCQSSGGIAERAAIWVDGSLDFLSDTTSKVTDVQVKNSHVYISFNETARGESHAVFYKDNVKTQLPGRALVTSIVLL